ncbi:SDR family NAD(P)-dependent oxidoreductase [Streptoalloteichus hindustanus]|uniref:NAD(P)-dependent dehydrogenase, short-chain alcohol dehydrogenase family n=1 Tax=Streptoalloteichus hindustanus TaxID=2017 RepID=A0A1M5EY46_STRHI|nr:SDR family oxidoreductase [Streptoalloteichus hindustanus]SHF84175.1 NAD(P)-dependent dehydrogenase, short-chain alcohol dehydrogenase family [Streptoalloteichus hindustanus]
MFSLQGKTAVVTGAAAGIGRAIASRLAAAGAVVTLADLTDASALAAELGGHYVRTDVADEDQVAALMAGVAGDGRIDICVNNAGVDSDGLIAELGEAEVLRVMRVNTLGVLYGIKHAAKHMTGGGAVVNTASLAAVQGVPGYAAYSMSKAAVLALTRAAAVEYGHAGVRINCVCPSSVRTAMLATETGVVEEAVTTLAAPLGRVLEPAEVAAAVHFLVADDCPVVSGQAINLDGGVSAGISLPAIGALFEAWRARGAH